jgi:nicotinamidase/pyrazinamidase
MKALLLVDIQNDFLPGGALAVNEGNTIIPIVNQLVTKFDLVVATQDWHPTNHESFASNHSGGQVGQVIDLHGLTQVLWPDHCIQNTRGAEFSSELDTETVQKIFRKGTDPTVDSYSGFYDNDHRNDTGLGTYLREKEVDQLYVVGLATDYCVKFTALDAAALGFETTVITDAVRAVNLDPNDGNKALQEMKQSGVRLLQSNEISS